MRIRVTSLILAVAVLPGCGKAPTTIDPFFQHITDSLAQRFVAGGRAESVYCIAIDQSGGVLSLFQSGRDGGIGTPVTGHMILPGALCLPALVGAALTDSVLTLDPDAPAPLRKSDPSPVSAEELTEGLAYSRMRLSALLASAYGGDSPYESNVPKWRGWLSLIPVNAQDKERYYLQLFTGEAVMVRCDELASFFNAVTGGGVRKPPRINPNSASWQERILDEAVADTLRGILLKVAGSPRSPSYAGNLGFPVTGMGASVKTRPCKGGEGACVSTYVGTFHLPGDERLTLLVSTELEGSGPETGANDLFRELALEYREAASSGVRGPITTNKTNP